jgi:hypothetical protein
MLHCCTAAAAAAATAAAAAGGDKSGAPTAAHQLKAKCSAATYYLVHPLISVTINN